jgi:hypothetical protein
MVYPCFDLFVLCLSKKFPITITQSFPLDFNPLFLCGGGDQNALGLKLPSTTLSSCGSSGDSIKLISQTPGGVWYTIIPKQQK